MWSTSSVCSLLGLCCPAQTLALWNFILKLCKLLVGLADWSQVCVLLPKTPSCRPALPFWGAARNQLGFIVCREHVVWFSCAGRGQGAAPRGAVWAQECSRDGPEQFQGFAECQVLLGCSELWLCSNSSVCFAVPLGRDLCPLVQQLWVLSMPGAPGLLLGSSDEISASWVLSGQSLKSWEWWAGEPRWLLWKWFPQKFCICLADNCPCAVLLSPGLLELEFCWWSTLLDLNVLALSWQTCLVLLLLSEEILPSSN